MNIELQNPLLSQSLGWLFIGLSCLFLLGLLPRMARIFYPLGSGIAQRAAAPVLFALLATAYFGGLGIEALGLVAVGGIVLVTAARRDTQRLEGMAKRRV